MTDSRRDQSTRDSITSGNALWRLTRFTYAGLIEFINRFYVQSTGRRTRALRFILLYGVVILFFAIFYYDSGASAFYAPYVKWEPDSSKARDRITAVIGKLIVGQSMDSYNSEDRQLYKNDPIVTSVSVIEPVRIDDSYTLDDSLEVDYKPSLKCFYQLKIYLERGYGTHPIDQLAAEDHFYVHTSVKNDTHNGTPNICEILSHHFLLLQVFNEEGDIRDQAILMKVGEVHWLGRFIAGQEGDPFYVPGFFARCLYFSATTITTTGFGDIVPLRRKVRAMTALEAVFGWLIAGFFLNGIATNIKNKPVRFAKE